jgi:hypothetical protein
MEINRREITSYEHACELADAKSEATGERHIGIDRGRQTSPQFDVVEAPVVGAEISYAFNGDYYPCGTIVSISETMKKITSSTGRSFYRRRKTASWVASKTWTMVKGHIERRNPHF